MVVWECETLSDLNPWQIETGTPTPPLQWPFLPPCFASPQRSTHFLKNQVKSDQTFLVEVSKYSPSTKIERRKPNIYRQNFKWFNGLYRESHIQKEGSVFHLSGSLNELILFVLMNELTRKVLYE